MKQGWELKTLGDVCSVQRGLTYSGKDAVDYSSTVVLRATNIDLESSSLVFDELKYLRDDFEIKDEYELKKDSLLICFSSGSKRHLGKVALVDNHYKYAFGGFIGQITPNNNINPKYLFYSLISEDYKSYIAQLTDGVNINNLKIKDLQSFQIPIPPLEEQKRIVAKLDQCFEAIDKAKANAAKNLENAKELFQSKLNDIFSQKGEGWVEKKLGDVCSLEYGKPLPKEDRDPDGLYPAYGANGIKTRTDKFLVNGRSIIVGRKGSAGEINYTEDKFWALDVTYYTKFDSNILDLDFLYYLLNLLKLPKLAKGVKPGINRNDVYAITIQLPPLKEQSKIAIEMKHLGNITNSLESKYQQELNSLEELKKSILQKAFEGELI